MKIVYLADNDMAYTFEFVLNFVSSDPVTVSPKQIIDIFICVNQINSFFYIFFIQT